MKNLSLILGWIIIFSAFYSSVSQAQDFNFKHIKLGSTLKKRAHIIENPDLYNEIDLKNARSKSNKSFERFSNVPRRALADSEKQLALALSLKIQEKNKEKKRNTLSKKVGISSEVLKLKGDSLLYKSLLTFLGGKYNEIGDQESQSIIDHADDFDLGEENFSGFNWHKPFGSYSVLVDRKVTPDYKNAKQWIVSDTFEVSIDAQTLIKKLVDSAMISLEGLGLEAFVGMSFKRKYTYFHFADSYEKGLRSDFTKLFLPFLQMNRQKILQMSPYNILKKEDYFSVSAGVSVETPPIYGFGLKGGIMAEYSRTASVKAQALGVNDTPKQNEFLRVEINKEVSTSVTANLELQADFFKLLKLTLFSYELQYKLSSKDNINLSFNQGDKKILQEKESKEAKEFSKLLRLFKLKVHYLEPNTVSLEQKKQSDLNSEYSALLFGKLKKHKTESVKIIKDNKVQQYYRHTSENVSVEKSLLSRIWATVVYKLLEFENTVKNVTYKAQKFIMEYQADRKQNTRVNSTDKFSLEFTNLIEVQKTTGWIRKRYRKLMAKSVLNLTNLNSKFAKKIISQEIVGPFSLDQKVIVSQEAINVLHTYSEDFVFSHLAKVCRSKRANKWSRAKKRRKYLKRLQVGKELCVKKLGKRYLNYIQDFKEYAVIDLEKLKKFMTFYLKKSKTYLDLVHLFGSKNLFIHGRLSGKTNRGKSFTSYFNFGVFRGLGLIESKRRNSSMVPIEY
ncbi:MAG: hypothetical protein ACI9QD_000631 [Thermoproteota archaeon]|jgi:hypothetical protein